MAQEHSKTCRTIIVSNRLPFTVGVKGRELNFRESVGGLVSGLSAYLDSIKGSSSSAEYLWIGWPGITVGSQARESLKSRALSEFHAVPVSLTEKTMDKFYLGFCNKTLWPLFHYFPSYAVYDEDAWLQYKKVNKTFCDAVLEVVKPDDVVWIQDYHLMLLPALLREKMPKISIGFFLHIPFPSYEIFRLLPRKWRQEILDGLLGADLIGFHTHDYTQYFLRCVLRILGYEHNLGKIVLGDRVAKADTFPMGIDFQKYYKAESNPEVRKEISKRRKQLSNLKVVLSVDRLDYTKGILNRLQGYEIFLEKNPQWRKKVMLVLVVVPSRIGVEQYQQMKRQVDELVGKINGRWGTIGWTPISYQYRYLSFAPLVALYRVSDVSLVTPLRDGMNLVAKEYVATQTDKSSVLILSEMAGASKELGEAIIINPNNREEIAEAIKVALEMPLEEQKRRNLIMQERLMRYDVIRWANEFINELLLLKEEQVQFEARLLDSKGQEQLIKDFNNAQRRLIFLDYDGTLVPFADDPKKAKPTDELLEILERLSCLPSTEIVLISGRPKDNLQSWFGTLNICLVAEHGVWIKEKAADWKLAKPLTADWKAQLLPILNMYVDRLPQSFVEEKEFSIAFHYRRADPELASIRAKELIDDLVHFTANIDVQIFPGNKVVEIRNSGISKGTAGLYWIAKDEFDFIMAVGDDWTDEDLFKVLPKTAYSIRVGMASSHAKWNLHNPLETVQLLEQLVKK